MVLVVDPDRRVVVLQIISKYICRKLGARYGNEEFTAGRGEGPSLPENSVVRQDDSGGQSGFNHPRLFLTFSPGLLIP